MVRDLDRLVSRQFDVLVVGGGIYGLSAAYDAAQRGLSVALVERGDFGGGNSFNHFKTIHGGLRYLQRAQLHRMRQSIRERRTTARLAPHLIRPQPFLIGTSGHLLRSRLALRAALLVNDVIGWDRNKGVAPDRRLPAGLLLSRGAVLEQSQDFNDHLLTGGALWYDYQVPETERLTMAVALAADCHGATLANYVEAVQPLKSHRLVEGMHAKDMLTGRAFDIEARVTLNAAGAAVGSVMASCGITGQPSLLLKAMSIVTSRPAGPFAVGAVTSGGRHLFLVPWKGRAMIGTWESRNAREADDVQVSVEELGSFLDEINSAYPSLRLSADEVTLVHRGIVPAARRTDGTLTLQEDYEIRDHAADGVDGLVSVMGVKYTTARQVTEQTIDLVADKLNRLASSRTATTALPGGDMESVGSLLAEVVPRYEDRIDRESLVQLVLKYGTEAKRVADLALERRDWTDRVCPSQPVIRAEIVRAVRDEMALTLTDVVCRRTGLGSAGYPGIDAVRACTTILAAELGWDEHRVDREVQELARYYAPARHLLRPES